MTSNTRTAAELEPSGVDLARVALRAAQESARRRGTEQSARKPKRRGRLVPRDSRDPIGLGQAIVGLIADRAWETPAAGGSVLDQWPAIAGDLAQHVAAVSFDGETGRLDLQPESPAYATHLKFEANRLISKANETVRAGTVKTIRILRPGTVGRPLTRPGQDADGVPEYRAPSAPSVPSESRREPPAGYLEAVKAARAHRAPLQQAPMELAAITERQSRDSRTRGRVQGPDADIGPMLQHETTEQTRQRALRRLALERQADRAERRKVGAETDQPRVQ
ncbi:DciA family protein [Streptomyces nodosus]|uniref:DciA family protein n=1 Tax=Streptomyces nodosus TaxID=40318 RepID=UPI003456EB38